jgi:hypothetical protein
MAAEAEQSEAMARGRVESGDGARASGVREWLRRASGVR